LRQRSEARRQTALSIAVGVALVLFWHLLVQLRHYPEFILPSPGQVARRALEVVRDGTLWRHTSVTLIEVMSGLAIGAGSALVIGYSLARWQPLERILSPYIVAAQSVPIVALAPLLIIWAGFGLTSKVLVCALIVFFPMMVATMVGVRGVPRDLLDAMHVLRATPVQVFLKLQVPAALPVLFGGLRLSVTLAVVGAVVGEFVGADRGLGFLVNQSKGLFDTPMMFVALATLAAIAVGLYVGVLALERKLLAWR
jgi:NitT/TauT family transport system permease protein